MQRKRRTDYIIDRLIFKNSIYVLSGKSRQLLINDELISNIAQKNFIQFFLKKNE